MNLLKYRNLAGMLALLIYGALYTACKKEYEQTPYNYTHLLSFSYTDTAGVVHKAAIQGDSIVIYWPQRLTQTPDIIPTIVVAEKATVNPASGSPVKLANGTSITVTAEDSTKKTYYIKLVQNLPDLVLASNAVTGELLMNLNRGITYYFGLDSGINRPDVGVGVFFKNFYADAPDTKFSLIGAGEKEIPLNFTLTPDYNVSFVMGFDIDTGSYRMKVVNAGRTKISSKQNVTVKYGWQSYGTVSSNLVLTKGGTVTIAGTFNQDFPKIVAKLKLIKLQFSYIHTPYPDTYGYPISQDTLTYEFPYISHTETTATFRVPSSIPTMDSFYGWNFENTTETDPWTVGFWDGTPNNGTSLTNRNI
ncbi:MAG TPA: hypothetical protein VJ647_03405, partial [Chitinophagaceae bacterium]|nr:hypothetical protein [Chitinophagaceae bacterium]